MQFFYSATNGSDTGSVVAAVVGNEATANLSDLLPATTYTVYGVVTATNGSTPQSSSTTFTTEGARTDHAAWYELPAKDNAGSNMLLRTFYDTARNYTMYYDTSTYTAYWVAYPLAAGDLGSGRPNDPWAATPGIPTSQQINVWAGSYGVNVGSTSNIYARGHQIPNADRNKDPYGTMCAQTFYATNSTPQIQNGFNSGIWSSLEGDVRTLAQQQTDTVYVVTGAILRTVTGNETITYIKPAKDTKKSIRQPGIHTIIDPEQIFFHLTGASCPNSVEQTRNPGRTTGTNTAKGALHRHLSPSRIESNGYWHLSAICSIQRAFATTAAWPPEILLIN